MNSFEAAVVVFMIILAGYIIGESGNKAPLPASCETAGEAIPGASSLGQTGGANGVAPSASGAGAVK